MRTNHVSPASANSRVSIWAIINRACYSNRSIWIVSTSRAQIVRVTLSQHSDPLREAHILVLNRIESPIICLYRHSHSSQTPITIANWVVVAAVMRRKMMMINLGRRVSSMNKITSRLICLTLIRIKIKTKVNNTFKKCFKYLKVLWYGAWGSGVSAKAWIIYNKPKKNWGTSGSSPRYTRDSKNKPFVKFNSTKLIKIWVNESDTLLQNIPDACKDFACSLNQTWSTLRSSESMMSDLILS